ncbi:TetR/AcrR family transcriptional regulator [Flavobacterium sp. ASW18X]|uniref:TetR/AcrR family transcriptional regulator n=1 Tax=Flavobacterium sp. ASW18X TaxID=2572595 RepID=UPI0010AEA6E1|nr:TetR/AcrR family transcriptional regulator [Flavobacterium sp. ASW18X]TKD65231.1 TetR/AcrR family transcriptional regulator [Flavobacterium sp. ASW18X]
MKRSNIKEHITATAAHLFYTQGYNRTGVNEIVAKSDIAKATLYHHFKSKEDICMAYLNDRHDKFMLGLKEFIAEKTDSKQQLLGIFDYVRDRYREAPFCGDWGLKTLSEITKEEEEIWNLIKKQKKELLFFLGEIVGRTVANVSKAETEKISGAIYMLFQSAMMETYLHENDWPIHLAKSVVPSVLQDVQLL